MDYTTTVYYYIAENEPSQALSVLSNYGYTMSPNGAGIDDIAMALQDMCQTYGDQAFDDMISIHPDKAIILDRFGNQNASNSNRSVGNMTATPTPSSTTGTSGNQHSQDATSPSSSSNATTVAHTATSSTHPSGTMIPYTGTHTDGTTPLSSNQIMNSMMILAGAIIIGALIASKS
jgi:hypothetical protein